VTGPHPDTSGGPGKFLDPEPAVRTGALIGYTRAGTSGVLDRQQHALAEAGCLRVFADKLSAKNPDRPELAACLDYLRPGDTLVVLSLDRLSRSLTDLIQIVGTLRRRSVGFKSLHEALDTTTPGGRLIFHVFAVLAEFIRELIADGTREGADADRRARHIPRKIMHCVVGLIIGVSTSTICGLPYAHSIAQAYEHVTTPIINSLPVLPDNGVNTSGNVVNTGDITTSISGNTITCSASSGSVSLTMSDGKSICMGN
jgi:hypothetical protein